WGAMTPTMPSRKVRTQTAKMMPSMIVTHEPVCARQVSIVTITKAPTTGPKMVPMPPSSVISTTSPEVVQYTSVTEANWNTSDLVDPARPAKVADSTKASSL